MYYSINGARRIAGSYAAQIYIFESPFTDGSSPKYENENIKIVIEYIRIYL